MVTAIKPRGFLLNVCLVYTCIMVCIMNIHFIGSVAGLLFLLANYCFQAPTHAQLFFSAVHDRVKNDTHVSRPGVGSKLT